MRDDEDLERVAKARVDHMPAETAGGRIDESAARPGDTGDSSDVGPQQGEGRATGASDMPGGGIDTSLGDESTGGKAAEEAIGARPGEQGTEIDDRTEQ